MTNYLILALALCLANTFSAHSAETAPKFPSDQKFKQQKTKSSGIEENTQPQAKARYVTTSSTKPTRSSSASCLTAAWYSDDGTTWRVRVWDDAGDELAWSSNLSNAPANITPQALYLQECNSTCYLIKGYIDLTTTNAQSQNPCVLLALDATTGDVLATANLTLSDDNNAFNDNSDVQTSLFVGTPVCCAGPSTDTLYVPLWAFDLGFNSDWDLGTWDVINNTMIPLGYDGIGNGISAAQLICCSNTPLIVYQLTSGTLNAHDLTPVPNDYTPLSGTQIGTSNNVQSFSILTCNDVCWVAAWNEGTSGRSTSSALNLDLWSVTGSGNTITVTQENSGSALTTITLSDTPLAVQLFCCDQTTGTVGIAAAYQTGGTNYLQVWSYNQGTQTLSGPITLVDNTNPADLYVNTTTNTCILTPLTCSNGVCGLTSFDAAGNIIVWSNFDFTNLAANRNPIPFAPIGVDMMISDSTRFGLQVSSCGLVNCNLVALLPGSVFLSSWLLSLVTSESSSYATPSTCFCRVFNQACARGSIDLAVQLYLNASDENRTCICTADPLCVAQVLSNAAASIIEPARLLPELCCSLFADNTVNLLTVLFSTTTDQNLIARLTREVADQGCCDVLAQTLTALVKTNGSNMTAICTMLDNLEPYCSFCTVVSTWFYNMISSPSIGSDAASTLLAGLLANSYCTAAQNVLTCLCCSFTEATNGVDAAPLIADAMIKLQTLYNTTTTLNNCA